MNKSVLWGILFSLFIIFTLTSCEEDPYPDYSRLTAPTGVSGSVVSNGIRLSWNTVDDAKFYMICRASSLNGSKVMLSYIGDGGYIYNNNVIDTNPLDGNP